MTDPDEHFFERADEHIHLSNRQMANVGMGKVSASMMYSTARFNAWVSARGCNNSQEMAQAKQDIITYFVAEYEKMLIENVEDYIDNFDKYMKP